jgi:sugar O-acyltransferase (sialic acid O-acetyltransferase NeuD family)/putative phosphoesterase
VTRLGIIADVHGNLPALGAIVAAAGPVDGWIVAGDIAGHLPFIDETAARLRELGAHCVKGNHDAAIVDGSAIPGSSAATRALQLQRTYVKRETLAWLAGLPDRLDLKYEGCTVTVLHGGPASPYFQKVNEITDELRAFAAGRILVLGHTHHFLSESGENYAVLNPGSAGLPVNGDPRGLAVILELPTRTVSRIAAAYDAAPLVARMRELGYDERYANCLASGRWTGFSGVPPKRRIIVVGASIYGEMIAELVGSRTDTEMVGFVDDSSALAGASIGGCPVLGRLADLADIARENGVTDVAVAIGDNVKRKAVAELVKRQGVRLATLVHPQATVSPVARLARGVIVDAQAYVGPYCELGEGVSIWPGAVVSHHTHIGDYASVKPGAMIGGYTAVAAGVKIELGSVQPSYSHQ